jgi:hypothetical protein
VTSPPERTVYGIDGENFMTVEGFFEEISRVRIPGTFAGWGRNLDAFDDICIAPEGLKATSYSSWNNHGVSRRRLGYGETVRHLEVRSIAPFQTLRASS